MLRTEAFGKAAPALAQERKRLKEYDNKGTVNKKSNDEDLIKRRPSAC